MNIVRFSALTEVSIHNNYFVNGKGNLNVLGGEYTVSGQQMGKGYLANFTGCKGSVSVGLPGDTPVSIANTEFTPFNGDASNFVRNLDISDQEGLIKDTLKLQRIDKELRSE